MIGHVISSPPFHLDIDSFDDVPHFGEDGSNAGIRTCCVQVCVKLSSSELRHTPSVSARTRRFVLMWLRKGTLDFRPLIWSPVLTILIDMGTCFNRGGRNLSFTLDASS